MKELDILVFVFFRMEHHICHKTDRFQKSRRRRRNSKPNPKVIFYRFLKLFRNQNLEKFLETFLLPIFRIDRFQKSFIFWRNDFKKPMLHIHKFQIFAKSHFNQRIVTIFYFFQHFFSIFSAFLILSEKSDVLS